MLTATSTAKQKSSRPFIIGICGGPSSGKTALARKIADRIAPSPVGILTMDDFHRNSSELERPQPDQGRFDIYSPAAFDFELILDVLQKLRNGDDVRSPTSSLDKNSEEEKVKTLQNAKVIIFEGNFVFHESRLCQLFDAKLFVDASEIIRYDRWLAKNTCLETAKEQYSLVVQPAYEKYIKPHRNTATIVVPSNHCNQIAVNVIVTFLKSKLAESN